MKRKLLNLKKEESTQTKMALIALLALVVGSVVQAQPVDLSLWTAESYPAVYGFPAGVWTVAVDNLSVHQSMNGQPTLFYSDFPAFNTSFQGRIKVETTSDNDFIGFALGFQPGDTSNSSADYLLVDWKRGDQWYDFDPPSCTPGSFAPRGLAVSRVFGIPTADEFWGHTNFNSPACSDLNNGLQELQRGATLGSTGWADNTEYEFKFEFSSTSLKVFVDGTLEIDITGSFSDGRIAFYNFSQASVRYSGFTVASLVDIDVKPGSFPSSVNLKSKGVTPVAIHTTDTFNATEVDPESVMLGFCAIPVNWEQYDCDEIPNPDYIDPISTPDEPEMIGDGDIDLVLYFETRDLVCLGDVTEVTLTGTTFGGVDIIGTSDISFVKQGKP